MEEMHGPFNGFRGKDREKISNKREEIAQTSHKDIEKEGGKSASIALGLIYDVEHKRFHAVRKDLTTGRIRIECTCDEAYQEDSTSVSAA